MGGIAVKTIGVLGGMGPQATMDFEARIHAAAQRLVAQKFNSGYPPMVVYYYRRPPFLLDEHGAPRRPLSFDPELLRAAKRIGTIADFLVITSNAPHLVQDEIEKESGREVLSMIDVTLEEVGSRGWKRAGVLGFGEPTVYTTRLTPLGISYDLLDAAARTRLDGGIGRIMEGRATAEDRRTALGAVNELRARGVDGIILGCTEIPLLLGADADAPDLLNPAALLAEAAVRLAIRERREG